MLTCHVLAAVQKEDGGWSVEWDSEDFVARSPHSIADSVPAKWVGVVTMRSFRGGVYPDDLTEEDKEYIKAAMRPKAVRVAATAEGLLGATSCGFLWSRRPCGCTGGVCVRG